MPVVVRNTAVFALILLGLLLGFWAVVGFALPGRPELKTSDLVFGLGLAFLITGVASLGYGVAISMFGRAAVPSTRLAAGAAGLAFGLLFVGVWMGGFALALGGPLGIGLGVVVAGGVAGAVVVAVARRLR